MKDEEPRANEERLWGIAPISSVSTRFLQPQRGGHSPSPGQRPGGRIEQKCPAPTGRSFIGRFVHLVPTNDRPVGAERSVVNHLPGPMARAGRTNAPLGRKTNTRPRKQAPTKNRKRR